jgi:16S rRNA (uracil1498-N3)-methyltransferase
VSAPVFVVNPAVLATAQPGAVIVVDGFEGRHAVTVTRIRVGEEVDIVDAHGTRAAGTVLAIVGRDAMHVTVTRLEHEVVRQPRIIVVQALAKGDRGELAVEQLTEIGVDVIVPWAAANCVVQWRGDRELKGYQRWAVAAHSAAKQSRRAWFPQIADLANTDDVVKLIRGAARAVILHETAEQAIGNIEMPPSGELVLIVGTEGGLAPKELEILQWAGAVAVRLGPTVMRTSSAGMVGVAALLSGSTRWSVGRGGVEG